MIKEEVEEQIKINPNEDWEMEWWPWRLGVSKKELINAIRNVGPVLKKVKRYLSIRK